MEYNSISYQDFLKILQSENEYDKDKDKEGDLDDQGIAISNEIRADRNKEQQEDEKSDMSCLTNLCRVCGSRGMIHIHSIICDKYLTIPRSRLAQLQQVTIADMISLISDEEIDQCDNLPKFICPHCLSYLQHAFNIRLKIKSTAENLRKMQQIIGEESASLEINQNNRHINVNQKEIIANNEEIEEQKYWHETFDKKNAKVKITMPEVPKSSKETEKAVEIKCPACFRKSYSIKSHNVHMSGCIINVFKIFFSEFQSIFTKRFEKKITESEYILYAISIVFSYAKKIEKIAEKNHIDITAINQTLTPSPIQEPLPKTNQYQQQQQQQASSSYNPFVPRTNNSPIYSQKNRFNSPDYGYYSNTNQ